MLVKNAKPSTAKTLSKFLYLPPLNDDLLSKLGIIIILSMGIRKPTYKEIQAIIQFICSN